MPVQRMMVVPMDARFRLGFNLASRLTLGATTALAKGVVEVPEAEDNDSVPDPKKKKKHPKKKAKPKEEEEEDKAAPGS